jgi:uncharacterized membrane protein YcaP (DUF421 family)
MWFDSWTELGRVFAVGAAAYVTLVAVLRVSGKRTLSKLNAYDFVVTVAFGSTLATILLNTSVSWADGAVALALLALLQLAFAWLGSRLPVVRSVVTARPSYLVKDGVLLERALKEQRVAVTEIDQAVRGTGTGSLESVAAVVLETDGTLSVISRSGLGSGTALDDVPAPREEVTPNRKEVP